MFLKIIGLVVIFIGITLPLVEAYEDRGWPIALAKPGLCLIALGLLCVFV